MEKERAIAAVYRDDRARIIATLVRSTRDIDAAEDAFQEAMIRASKTWTDSDIPRNPAAWVLTTARNVVIDQARRRTSLQSKLPLLLVDESTPEEIDTADAEFGDDRLRLIFTCCHPVLDPEARIALTLRVICGLSTAEIASLFLVQEATMAARITRAKKKLAASGVPYRIPLPQDLEQRLSDVLAVIYLVATEAHTPSHSEGFHHANHMELALTLSRIMTEHLPQHPEVLGLHALILFADARNQSRLDASGNVLRLDEMDRTLWDDGKIGEATSLTERAMQLATPETVGPYPLQAAIAAVHAEAPTFDETDWPQVVALYGMLEKVSPSPVVRLARSIAVSMRDGPDAGLAMIRAERLQEQLAGYPMLPAALADLHRRSGDCAEAETWYRRAAELTHNETMRDWFWSQAAIMREQAGS